MAKQLTPIVETAVCPLRSLATAVHGLWRAGLGAADGLLARRPIANWSARGEEVVARQRTRLAACVEARQTAVRDARAMAGATAGDYLDSLLACLRLPSAADLAVLGKELELLEQKLAEPRLAPAGKPSPASTMTPDDARAQEIAATLARIRAVARARRQAKPGAQGGM